VYQWEGSSYQEWGTGNALVNAGSQLYLTDPDYSHENFAYLDLEYAEFDAGGDPGENRYWQLANTDSLFVPNAGAGTSHNWSGYVAATNLASPQPNSVSAVSGSWIVPTVTGPASGSTKSSVWVGIDGFKDSSVEQIGTEQEVVNGTPGYYAWWEMYSSGTGQPEQRIATMTIDPGDSISASVQYLTSGAYAGEFHLSMVDNTRDESFSTYVSSAQYQSPQAQRSSAEWIVEAPTVGGRYANLANFGSVRFSNAYATINNVTGPIDSSSSQSSALNITGNPTTNDTTSVLKDSGPHARSSFVVTADPTSSSGVASGTNVGSATGICPPVGVTIPSGLREDVPGIGGLPVVGTMSPLRYGTLIGQRERPAQGLSFHGAAIDAVFADYDPMEYHLMSRGGRKGRVLSGPTCA
jgi:Peptidase A4 family